MTDKLTGEWTTLRAGGACSMVDATTQLALRPRMMLEYTARASDPATFGLFAGDQEPEAIATWIGQMLVQICGTYLQQRPILDSMSGAYPLAEEVTPLANAELAPNGIEIAVSTFRVSLSEEDNDELERVVKARAYANLLEAEKLMGGGS